MNPVHTAIFDWLQLDPAHYEGMGIESLGDDCYRLTFLDESVSDWRFYFDEDGIVVNGICYQDVI
jgi:hypothetical protein